MLVLAATVSIPALLMLAVSPAGTDTTEYVSGGSATPCTFDDAEIVMALEVTVWSSPFVPGCGAVIAIDDGLALEVKSTGTVYVPTWVQVVSTPA